MSLKEKLSAADVVCLALDVAQVKVSPGLFVWFCFLDILAVMSKLKIGTTHLCKVYFCDVCSTRIVTFSLKSLFTAVERKP